ncbi:MAG TPA: hypothetical protein VFK44_13095 [Bacillales bacterium]|nr:hypothetical protein [Bacillales bacterium]
MDQLRLTPDSMKMNQRLETKPLKLMEGQIYRGKLLRWFPENLAVVELAGRHIRAKVYAPLVAGNFYWLEVKNANGTPELKVLPTRAEASMGATIGQLLEKLGLPNDRTHQLLVKMILEADLPLSRSVVESGAGWLKQAGATESAFRALQMMFEQQLPFSKTVFDGLLTSLKTPLSESLNLFAALLSAGGSGIDDAAAKTVRKQIGDLFLQMRPSGTEMKAQLQRAIDTLGLSYEQAVAKAVGSRSTVEESVKTMLTHMSGQSPIPDVKTEANRLLVQLSEDLTASRRPKFFKELLRFVISHQASSDGTATSGPPRALPLKAMLMEVLQQVPNAETKQAAQTLLNHVTGSQLQAAAPYQSVIQLPFYNGKSFTDITIEWHGKKRKNGEWDADHCRILFYLNLAHLHETALDVNVQKRIVSVKLYNESYDLRDLIEACLPALREHLETSGYQLSSFIQAEGKAEKPRQANEFNQQKGVDYRV